MTDDMVALALRDLLWTVQSPSLLASGENVVPASEIDAARIDVDLLQKFVGQSAEHRVGKYFERLVHFYLQHIRKVEIVVQGKQIKQKGRTVGELDFVFKNAGGELQHWETAVKFFLHLPDRQVSGSHLIGPNPADCFENKLERMHKHQLPLSAYAFPNISDRQILMKGRIFYHINSCPEGMKTLPQALASGHLRGLWCRENELRDYAACILKDNQAARILPKPHWLSADVVDSTNENCLRSEFLAQRAESHFRQTRRPLLISLLQPHGAQLTEYNRLFVVDNSWPESA